MRLTVRFLGAEVLDLDLHATPPPARPACRFTPAPDVEPPTFEASGGGEFALGFHPPGRAAYLPDGERPDAV